MTEAPAARSKSLAGLAGVRHGYFGRKGGVSAGIYDSLNCGPGSNDAPESVRENRARVARTLGAGHLLSLYQVHGIEVITVHEAWENGASRPRCDAMVTDRPGLALGTLAADCGPVLFADAEGGVIGAAHAGWKGALAGVLESTVEAMVAQGAAPDRIRAALGPCLRQREFEVGRDLVDAFCSKHPEAARFFAPGAAPDKRQFDLAGFGFWRLAESGVTRTEDAGGSTLAEPDAYFSYRASRRAGEDDYGRNLSAIALPA